MPLVLVSTVILKLCDNTYMGLRMMRIGLMYVMVGYAERGLTAGCNFAYSWVCVYCLEGFDEVVKACPRVSFDFDVDDFIASSFGRGKEAIAADLADAAGRLYDIITGNLCADLAYDKADVGPFVRLAIWLVTPRRILLLLTWGLIAILGLPGHNGAKPSRGKHDLSRARLGSSVFCR